MKLVECVPNFSEGREKGKVDTIVEAARSVPGIQILDVEMDKDHHRSVLTFVGSPEAASEAAFRAASRARELIDLTKHQGEHPRMGATDVVPFIPVAGVTMDDCVSLARKLGERIGKELDIPVYLYGHAAARLERQDLAAVRKGQFEGLRTAIESDPARSPDYGPSRIHPTAGATAVGAREQIVNFNVNLDLTDMEAGKAIAKKIRTSGGGLPELRAKEIRLSSGNVQISTVLTNYKKTSLLTVFQAIKQEAAAKGARVVSSEIIGLVPRKVIEDCARESILLQGFQFDAQVLEERLAGIPGGQARLSWHESAAALSAALSNTEPTPGGGTAGAIAGAMGAGLAEMAVGISLLSKKLEPARKPLLEKLAKDFAQARDRFLVLADDDAAAFEMFVNILKSPKGQPGRDESLQKALYHAAEVPLSTSRLAIEMQKKTADAVSACSGSVVSDMRCAGEFLRCAAKCAAENVRINTQSLNDKTAAAAMEKELERALAELN